MRCSDCQFARKSYRQLLESGEHRDVEFQCGYSTSTRFVRLVQNIPVFGESCNSPSWCPARSSSHGIDQFIQRSSFLPRRSGLFT